MAEDRPGSIPVESDGRYVKKTSMDIPAVVLVVLALSFHVAGRTPLVLEAPVRVAHDALVREHELDSLEVFARQERHRSSVCRA